MKQLELIKYTIPTEDVGLPRNNNNYEQAMLSMLVSGRGKTMIPVFENIDEFQDAQMCLFFAHGVSSDGVSSDGVYSYEGTIDLGNLARVTRIVKEEPSHLVVYREFMEDLPAIRELLQAQAPSILPIFNRNLRHVRKRKSHLPRECW